MLNPDTKIEIETLVGGNRGAPVPLLDGVQATFKKAADIDSSTSPIEQGLIDELDSTDSDDVGLTRS